MDDTTIESAEEIKKKVNVLVQFCLNKENTQLRQRNMDQYKKLCMDTHSYFHQKYPTLFFLIIENPSTFPMYRLDELLNVKKLVEQNKISEKNANVALGQKYYDEFVKDTVKKYDLLANKKLGQNK